MKTKAPTFRGSDFAMRYEQGRFSELRIIDSITASKEYCALPYGRSAVGPKDKGKIAAYFEEFTKLEGEGFKRPDILVLRRHDFEELQPYIQTLGDTTLATDEAMQPIFDRSVCAIEAENSLWVAEKMPDFGPRRVTRMNFVAPTIIVKEEDAQRLSAWQAHHNLPIAIVQVFFDRAFVTPLSSILERVEKIREAEEVERQRSGDSKLIRKASSAEQKALATFIREQKFVDARTGASTPKILYSTHYSAGVEFGVVDKDNLPTPVAEHLIEDNGKVMSYVRFEGGSLILSDSAKLLFEQLAAARKASAQSGS